jgi:hypothetical protein
MSENSTFPSHFSAFASGYRSVDNHEVGAAWYNKKGEIIVRLKYIPPNWEGVIVLKPKESQL